MSDTTMPNGSRKNPNNVQNDKKYKEMAVKTGDDIIERIKNSGMREFIVAGMETRVMNKINELKLEGTGGTNTGDGSSDAAVNNDKQVTVSSIIIRDLPSIRVDGARFAELLEDKETSMSKKLSGKGKDESTQDKGLEEK